MLTTKTHDALSGSGFTPGDTAYVGEVSFGDENDPNVESRGVGTFRTEAAAKRAVGAEVRRLEAAETRDGWWSGDVTSGTIIDKSGDWGRGYGHVENWDWERDDRAPATFYMAGKWQR